MTLSLASYHVIFGTAASVRVLALTSLDLSHTLPADLFRRHARSPKGHHASKKNPDSPLKARGLPEPPPRLGGWLPTTRPQHRVGGGPVDNHRHFGKRAVDQHPGALRVEQRGGK